MTVRFSEAFLLLWQLAGFEAQAGAHSQIHPEHFFLALCKADDIPIGALRDDGTPEMQAQLPTIERELRDVRAVFDRACYDRKTARRSLRARIETTGEPRPTDGIWHRTSDAKWLCDRAFRIAREEGEVAAAPIHLLKAFLHPEASFPILDEIFTESLRAALEPK